MKIFSFLIFFSFLSAVSYAQSWTSEHDMDRGTYYYFNEEAGEVNQYDYARRWLSLQLVINDSDKFLNDVSDFFIKNDYQVTDMLIDSMRHPVIFNFFRANKYKVKSSVADYEFGIMIQIRLPDVIEAREVQPSFIESGYFERVDLVGFTHG